jgi:hypothetical protein
MEINPSAALLQAIASAQVQPGAKPQLQPHPPAAAQHAPAAAQQPPAPGEVQLLPAAADASRVKELPRGSFLDIFV